MQDAYYAGVMIVSFGTAMTAFGVLRQRLIGHERLDDERFKKLHEDMKEIKADVKTLLSRGAPEVRR